VRYRVGDQWRRHGRPLLFALFLLLILLCAKKYLHQDHRPHSASALPGKGISVTHFGAEPVGLKRGYNSTAAFQRAINYAIKKQVPLMISEGTFEVDSGILKAIVPAGKSFEIIGEGEKSVVRRRSGSVWKDSQDILSITSFDGDVKQITLKNFSVDGNARGNPLPQGNEDPYLWQHSSSIRIKGVRSSAKIKKVAIEKLTCYDAVADHIYFPGDGDSFVDNVQVNGFYGYDRTRTRSDITVTGGVRTLDVTNSKMTRLEVELNRPSANRFVMKVSDVALTQKLDISGDNMEFYGERIHAADLGLWKVKGWIHDSKIHFQKDVIPPRADKLYAFEFVDTEFYYPVASDGNVYPLTLNYTFNVVFDRCKFLIDSPVDQSTGLGFNGRALETKARTNPSEMRMLKILNSEFDKRFSENIHLDRSGSAVLVNNVFSGSNAAIFMSGTKKSTLDVFIDGGSFEHVTGEPFQFLEVDGLSFSTKNLTIPSDDGIKTPFAIK
jgi:hypothetical protein